MKPRLKGLAHRLARILFALYGGWSWLWGPRPLLPFPRNAPHRILVIRLDLLGDAVFSTPAIRALAAAYPQAELDMLALPYTAPLLRTIPEIGRVYELDVNDYRRPGGLLKVGTLLAVIRSLRSRRYDLAVSLSRLVGGIFAVASGARWRAGPAAETYWGCFNVPLAGRRYAPGQHEVDFCLAVVQALGADAPGQPIPALTAESFAGQTTPGEPYVVIVPGASNGSAKRWPVRYWAELVDRLVRDSSFQVVVCGGASERELGSQLNLMVHVPVVDLVGRTSVPDLSGVLARAALVIAGDTGPLHLAAALGRPTLGIYGPTDPANTGPRSPMARVLRAGIPCSPCYDLRSPAECKLPDRSVACMWQVQPDQAFEAAAELLGATRPTATPRRDRRASRRSAP
ncbi:MAG: lipopolysaccharide heptosyltransferase II [Chloroflexi bacterium]|nr:lipopolysaccharide heptosyltransferase II [Chloroflexota bacterium]